MSDFRMTTAFVDFNGVVPEKVSWSAISANDRTDQIMVPKFDAVKLSHLVDAEYGNQGIDFKLIPREGFGWMNCMFLFLSGCLEQYSNLPLCSRVSGRPVLPHHSYAPRRSGMHKPRSLLQGGHCHGRKHSSHAKYCSDDGPPRARNAVAIYAVATVISPFRPQFLDSRTSYLCRPCLRAASFDSSAFLMPYSYYLTNRISFLAAHSLFFPIPYDTCIYELSHSMEIKSCLFCLSMQKDPYLDTGARTPSSRIKNSNNLT